MPELSKAWEAKIIRALEKAGVKQPCPRCQNRNFVLADGFFNQSIQTSIAGVILGGPTVPSVVTVCSRCGFLSQHALGVLGLLEEAQGADAGPEDAQEGEGAA